MSDLIPDTWRIDPDEFWHYRGNPPPVRPLFQGDVFEDVPLPTLPPQPPEPGMVETRYVQQRAMLLPHPCQCHKGDTVRPRLVVAPVELVPQGEGFRSGFASHWPYFPLEGLDGDSKVYRADLALVQTVPSAYLSPEQGRIACLSEIGVGLLMKRLLKFQTRVDHALGDVVASFHDDWVDAEIWQVWRETRGTAAGYEKWKNTEQTIQGLPEPVIPKHMLVGRTSQLIDHLRATAVV